MSSLFILHQPPGTNTPGMASTVDGEKPKKKRGLNTPFEF
jgi:hypothetical protein